MNNTSNKPWEVDKRFFRLSCIERILLKKNIGMAQKIHQIRVKTSQYIRLFPQNQ